MGLKALAVAALQQCAPRTNERTLLELATAQSPPRSEVARTLCDAESATVAAANDALLPADRQRAAMALAEQAIAQAALTDEQKLARRADLTNNPEITGFWARLLEPTIDTETPTPRQARRRCIECEHFARVGIGERCAHPDRSQPGEPARADCLPAHQCERFIHWWSTQSGKYTI